AHTGRQISADAVVAESVRGARPAEDTLARYAGRLARALATVINVLDPDVIVLGGGLSNSEALYDMVPRLWTEWVFTDVVRTRLVRNRHGDSSGVRGAAMLG
ncbi:MAG: ROK family protein, partial [Rhodospirillaceae bacterium]